MFSFNGPFDNKTKVNHLKLKSDPRCNERLNCKLKANPSILIYRQNLNKVGSGIRTCQDFEWLKSAWFANGLDFEWYLTSGSPNILNPAKWPPCFQKPFEILVNMAGF